MILHLLRMRRNVNRNVFNERKNVSATPFKQRLGEHTCLAGDGNLGKVTVSSRHYYILKSQGARSNVDVCITRM